MRRHRLNFPSASGLRLAALQELPVGEVRAQVLMAHCFTCGKNLASATQVSRELTALGFAVLRFDFTGLGASDGDFANTNFSSNVADLVAAANYLRSEHQAPALLIGHSLGGAAVLAAAELIEEVKAVATIGAPSEPAHVEKLLVSSLAEVESSGRAIVQIAGRNFTITAEFLKDIRQARIRSILTRASHALLVLHSPVDEIVGIDSATALFTAARHSKSFVSLDSADHLLSNPADAAYAASVIAAWAQRYLEPVLRETRAEGVVSVEEAEPGPFTQAICTDRHTWGADEPRALGGADTGPTPYDLLLSSLGACTAMTVRMYARRKKLALERVRVELRHEKVHIDDCENGNSGTRKLDQIHRVVFLQGPLDAAARQRLVEIADRCPVHQTLRAKVEIKTELGPLETVPTLR